LRYNLNNKGGHIMDTVDKAELVFICGAVAYFLLFLVVR